MGKVGQVAMTVGGIIILYIFLLIFMPIISGAAITANTTMDSSVNMSQFPGTSEALVSSPWGLWFAPGIIGIAMIVFILRRQP